MRPLVAAEHSGGCLTRGCLTGALDEPHRGIIQPLLPPKRLGQNLVVRHLSRIARRHGQCRPRIARHSIVAAVLLRHGVRHGGDRCDHPADRIGSVDGGMEAADRHAASPVGGRVEPRVRPVSGDSGIPLHQCRHVAGRVQAHLLLGMVPPAVGPVDRLRLPAALPVVLGDQAHPQGADAQAARAVPARRPSGRHRLVHGGERAGGQAVGQPLPAGAASGRRLRDLRADAVGGLGPARPEARIEPAAMRHRRCAAMPGWRWDW